MKFIIYPTRIGASPDLLKAIRIKGHYRHLPNGKVIWISEHDDKRNKHKKDPKKYKRKKIHSSEKETTVTNAQGESKTYKHEKHMELDQDDIHDVLNSAFTIDTKVAIDMFKHENGIEDMGEFLGELIDDEKEKAEITGKDPDFTNRIDAMKWIMKNKITKLTRDLQKQYGDVTTYARAAEDPKLRGYFEQILEDENSDYHDKAVAQMALEHSESAIEAYEEELAQVQVAQTMGPKDMPKIKGIAPEMMAFGHQAETLAKLNVLKKAIIDVDMGGGKGLILPADALNLMSQGKVKRPLIVVPGATLDQNAAKIHEYTNSQVNVFLISNRVIKQAYNGDEEAMIRDIRNAPPNTIFMASYDVFSYQKRDKKTMEESPEQAYQFERAQAMGSAGFDYVALDESHNIKNTASLRFQGMKYISKAKYKRVASGTFLSNNPADVLGQLTFLHPHTAIKKSTFEEKYGRVETKMGVKWDKDKLKNLRYDLTKLGMISLRRSAWIHALPERREKLSIVQMEKTHARIHDAVLTDVLDSIEEEMKKNPRLRKIFESDDGLDDMDEELPPQVVGALDLIGGITDYPHELAVTIEEKLATVKEAKKKATKTGEELDEETIALMNQLKRLKPHVRKLIMSLKGVVSPKAHDVYKKAKEHFKNKNAGKMIVFCQRKLSAQHIIDNMPEDMKKHAMYFDASKMGELPTFANDPKGPKILVAVDASIKEGMNLQIANKMYRYDHHYSPGNQEQSYARIWRFGQDKPADIDLGIVDGGVDVPKYARLISKLHTNQMVVSDMEDDDTFNAYKLSLNNIRENREAHILDEYMDMNKRIIDFQHEENKELKKRFGTKGYPMSAKGQIGGKEAAMMHGMGPYMDNVPAEERRIPDKDLDAILGHLRDVHKKNKLDHHVFDSQTQDFMFTEAIRLLNRHKAAGGGKKLSPETIDHYERMFEMNNDEEIHPAELKAITATVNNFLSGKKHTPHHKHDPIHAVKNALKLFGLKENKDASEAAKYDVEVMMDYLKKNDITLDYAGEGKIHNPEEVDEFWEKFAKEEGFKPSTKYKRMINAATAMYQEVAGGYDAIKDLYDDFLFETEEEE